MRVVLTARLLASSCAALALALSSLVASGHTSPGGPQLTPAPLQPAPHQANPEDGTMAQQPQSGAAPAPGAPTSADPDLEPGFPVDIDLWPGTYHAGPAIHTLVGNMDADPQLEIVVTGVAVGPLWAWNFDGTRVEGWPRRLAEGAGYMAMGELAPGLPGLEVFAGYWGRPGKLAAYAANNTYLPGWPRDSSNYVRTPPSLADVDGDGRDEIFVEEQDLLLHAYRADGSVLSGWPAPERRIYGGQGRHTPAIADLDLDGDLEIVTTSDATTAGWYLLAHHHDGSFVSGFPVLMPPSGYPDYFPVIGDVDGDGAPEILVLTHDDGSHDTYLAVVSASGALERRLVLGRINGAVTSYTGAPALADLDGDRVPEILVQATTGLGAWKGDGTFFPGWPVHWPSANSWPTSSSPVVGDLDGDGQPEVAIETPEDGFQWTKFGEVRVYNRFGGLLPNFPKRLPIGTGAVPAIADIDLDGRNELVVTGSYWDGYTAVADKVWVYDLRGAGPYGQVEWGQFGQNSRHHGFYRGALPILPTVTPVLPTPTIGPGCLFSDVCPPDYWFGPVEYLVRAGAISGYGDNTFRPFNDATRGQLSKIVVAAEGLPIDTAGGPHFRDVPTDSTFYASIETAYNRGIIGGYADGTFRPNNPVTRGQLTKIVAGAAGWTLLNPSAPTFGDVQPGNPFYREIETAAARGIISGYADGTFRWGNNATRGQISKIVYLAVIQE